MSNGSKTIPKSSNLLEEKDNDQNNKKDNNQLSRVKVPLRHGLGLGKNGKKSSKHRKILRDSIDGITKNDIRRLARRGGVKRISLSSYDAVRDALKDFLKDVIHRTIIYTDHSHRKTVTPQDVIYGLKSKGITFYGY